MDNLDKNGYELSEGDTVLCDGNQEGVVTKFGGIGIYVRMDDGVEIDWNNDQVEKA